MASFYPFTDPQKVRPEDVKEIPIAEEYDYDMSSARFRRDGGGHVYKVYGNPAIKIKLWKLFMSERYRWVVFPWSYGHELETLIGKAYTQGYINSEAERYTREAIDRALGDYIESLSDIKIDFDDGRLTISFVAKTIYGTLEVPGMPIGRW